MNPELPLRDIHLPDSVSWWPIAPGWWLLLVIAILIAMIIWAIRMNKAKGLLRKQALAELDKIENAFGQHQNTQQLASELSMLLRRVCISRFPRVDVAGLTGQAWITFLNSHANSFDDEIGRQLREAPYQQQHELDSHALICACRHWITEIKSISTHSFSPLTKRITTAGMQAGGQGKERLPTVKGLNT